MTLYIVYFAFEHDMEDHTVCGVFDTKEAALSLARGLQRQRGERSRHACVQAVGLNQTLDDDWETKVWLDLKTGEPI